MKLFLIFLIFITGFIAGRFSAPDSSVIIPNTAQPSSSPDNPTEIRSQQAENVIAQEIPVREPNNSLLSTTVLPTLIEAAPEQAVKDVMSYFFNQSDIEEISDINLFAKRYAEEMAQVSTSVDNLSAASLHVSASSSDRTHRNLLAISSEDSIYAHISFSGGLASGSEKIMTRWVNLDTNEVMFFEKSKIIATSDQNWVSFSPSEGWSVGNYEISLYQFSDQMRKLASQNFYVTTEQK